MKKIPCRISAYLRPSIYDSLQASRFSSDWIEKERYGVEKRIE
ncbi:hypothetical protein [Clostridium aminobutyricum]|nr:hypothetical protein [Clostridium aminobutyricum]